MGTPYCCSPLTYYLLTNYLLTTGLLLATSPTPNQVGISLAFLLDMCLTFNTAYRADERYVASSKYVSKLVK